MADEPRGAVLLVRSIADLGRAGEELAAFLSTLHRLSPDNVPELVQFVWIDEEAMANLPSELLLSGGSGPRRTVRILETAGINGIWMLCWLDAAASTIARVDLVAPLPERLGCEGKDPAALEQLP